MPNYLIIGKPRIDLIKELWFKMLSDELKNLKPFGENLHYSLLLSRLTKDRKVAWEYDEQFNSDFSQARYQVLDFYFESLNIQEVNEGEGWKAIEANYPFWPVAVGLPQREGKRPLTTKTLPHRQISDTIRPDLYKKLTEMVFSLPLVKEEMSLLSSQESKALWIDEHIKSARREILFEGLEFAHIHSPQEGSLHLILPNSWAKEVVEKGWGELHPLYEIGFYSHPFVLIYAPRNVDELLIVYEIVLISYLYAIGEKIIKPYSLFI